MYMLNRWKAGHKARARIKERRFFLPRNTGWMETFTQAIASQIPIDSSNDQVA